MHTTDIPGFPKDQLITNPSDASWFVANRVGNGSDHIKLIAEGGNGPRMTQAEHNALVAVSHQYGMKVMTHTADYASYQIAITSSTNIIQHIPVDKLIDKNMTSTMRRKKQASTPTLSVVKALI